MIIKYIFVSISKANLFDKDRWEHLPFWWAISRSQRPSCALDSPKWTLCHVTIDPDSYLRHTIYKSQKNQASWYYSDRLVNEWMNQSMNLTLSTRITRAPKSLRTLPQYGPGARPASSTTFIPLRAEFIINYSYIIYILYLKNPFICIILLEVFLT